MRETIRAQPLCLLCAIFDRTPALPVPSRNCASSFFLPFFKFTSALLLHSFPRVKQALIYWSSFYLDSPTSDGRGKLMSGFYDCLCPLQWIRFLLYATNNCSVQTPLGALLALPAFDTTAFDCVVWRRQVASASKSLSGLPGLPFKTPKRKEIQWACVTFFCLIRATEKICRFVFIMITQVKSSTLGGGFDLGPIW